MVQLIMQGSDLTNRLPAKNTGFYFPLTTFTYNNYLISPRLDKWSFVYFFLMRLPIFFLSKET